VSCASWALGSIYSRRLPLPKGLMASAAQMLAGGLVMLVLALLHGERMTAVPSARSALAPRIPDRRRIDRRLQRVPVPSLPSAPHAGSELCVREPGGGGGLGAALAGESVAPRAVGALALILGGVAMLARAGRLHSRRMGRAYLPRHVRPVAHLIYGLGFAAGATRRPTRGAQPRRGIESSILALGQDGPIRQLALRQGVPVELLPADGMSIPALMGIRRELEKRDATVLHAHDLGPGSNGVAVRALRPKTRVNGDVPRAAHAEGRSAMPPRWPRGPPTCWWRAATRCGRTSWAGRPAARACR